MASSKFCPIYGHKKMVTWHLLLPKPKQATLLELTPKEPIAFSAKALPCWEASAAVCSATVLAGASSLHVEQNKGRWDGTNFL
jgi:hypothetical protein